VSLPEIDDRPDLYDDAERWSVDELRSTQLERLRWSLTHAYENVPHYREAFDAKGFDPREVNGACRRSSRLVTSRGSKPLASNASR
jgi:phenylacetate-CoA ligase